MSRWRMVVPFLVTGFLACGDATDEQEAPTDAVVNTDLLTDVTTPITYTSQVKAILDKNCATCHASTRSGAARHGAPVDVNVDTYAELMKKRVNDDGTSESVAVEANDEIQTLGMPVDNNDADTGGLSAGDRATCQAWINAGMPE